MCEDELTRLAEAAGAQTAIPKGKRDLAGHAAASRDANRASVRCGLIALPCMVGGLALCGLGILYFGPLVLVGLPVLLVGVGFGLASQWLRRASAVGRWIR